ncbi:MAG: glycerol-3-phosphate acyltransferase, partial [Bacteroidales bacterium]|nr:glycerol-3-phosphate acyltransferase [Bacteroidales bacterium]
GIMSVLNFNAALICAAIFLMLFLLTGISSISSILSIAAFPIYIFFYTENPIISIKVFSIAVAVIVLITHHDNIIRLIKGKERRFFTWRKKDDNEQ